MCDSASMLELSDKMRHDVLLILVGGGREPFSCFRLVNSHPLQLMGVLISSTYFALLNEPRFVADNGQPIRASGLHMAACPCFKHQSFYSDPVYWQLASVLHFQEWLLCSIRERAGVCPWMKVTFDSDNDNLPLLLSSPCSSVILY